NEKESWTLSKKIFIVIIFAFVIIQTLFLLSGTSITSMAIGVDTSTIGKYTKLPLTNEGYEKLLEYDRTITLSDSEKKDFAGFNVRLPCCGFRVTSENENNDCRCGHHVAYAGLIKWGLKNGLTREQIQEEIDQWKPVFYPICAQNKALCDLA
ncbi:MAG: hypothetical protein QXQ18_01685, partial [Candidatus Aenigmatarchaeota archaeon]